MDSISTFQNGTIITNRIAYIDQAKGLAILMVIIGHLFHFCWCDLRPDMIRRFIMFEMPIFFFLSGLMAYRAMNCSYRIFLKKKIISLLFPFIFTGSLYIVFVAKPEPAQFWSILSHGPYWFMLTLFYVFILYHFFQTIYDKINVLIGGKDSMVKGLVYWSGWVLLFLSMQLFHIVPEWMNYYFNGVLVIMYFPFFVVGVLLSRYEKLEQIVMSETGYTIALIVFWITYFLLDSEHSIWSTIGFYILGLSGVVWIIYMLKRYEQSNPIGLALSKVGRRSLDIYVLHYFVLLWLPLKDYATIILENGILFELIVCIVLALIIAGCTMFIGEIIRISSVLSFLFLGDYQAGKSFLRKIRVNL